MTNECQTRRMLSEHEIMKTTLAAIIDMAEAAPTDADFRHRTWYIALTAMSKLSK
jgi:hypothetical protein